MKKFLYIILAFAVLHVCTLQVRREVAAQTGPAAFMMIVVGCGILLTIWVCKKGGQPAYHTFVLQKTYVDPDIATPEQWINVATNTLKMPLESAFPAFEVYTERDHRAFFRLMEIPLQLFGSPDWETFTNSVVRVPRG